MSLIKNKKDIYVAGAVLGMLAGLLWGFSGTFGQFLFDTRGFDAVWLTSTRMVFAGIIMLAICAAKYGKGIFDIWKDKQSRFDIIIYAVFCMAGVQVTYFTSIQYSNAATGTIIQYTGSAIVVVWVAMRARRLPNKFESSAVICAILGIFLISTHGKPDALVLSPFALIVGLISACMMAGYSIQPKRMLEKHGTLKVNGWGIFLGGVFMSIFRPPWELGGGNLDFYAVLATIGVIVLGTILSFLCYMEAVRIIGSTHAVLYACVEPLSSAVITIVWFKIEFGLIDWVGALLIISTVFIISRAPRNT